MRGFAPRFALESAFLVLVAVGAGLADLRPLVIAALMAGGWVLVSLIELAVWRARAVAVPPALPYAPATALPAAHPPAEPVESSPLRADGGYRPSQEGEEYTSVLSTRPDDP